MSSKLNKASAFAVAAMMTTILVSANGSGAAAESLDPVAIPQEPIPEIQLQVPQVASVESDAADSLAELVATQPYPQELSSELNCLAGAIYFESKGETLAGQLAVGRVVVARSKSGRFPGSYCGVVFQPSQFSFVRGNALPYVRKQSAEWKEAVAIAQIANEGTWRSPVEGALFFHATYVSPGWRLKRLARVDNHIFYR
ncbi:cell wall hydrolase [Novosphingobium sp.]|uniref:cell wall hydrolase n=1 Tax=Novosphingobium sp. TaxID=1874826 RepID=UPI002737190F|nr:cell wall hydrolase [Novosphingobium sp.]MDP3906279.1 cell wall hydrolase [Novosphingobium sp.]